MASDTDHGGGTGYTNGIDVHGGRGWVIGNNRFENFHPADDMQHLWNPVVLMWNGAVDSLIETNVFVDVDRAIALGLADRPLDHRRGIVRNNMIVLRRDLLGESRRTGSDGAVLVWNSPGSRILHDTIISQGNLARSIELRHVRRIRTHRATSTAMPARTIRSRTWEPTSSER